MPAKHHVTVVLFFFKEDIFTCQSRKSMFMLRHIMAEFYVTILITGTTD